MSYGYRTAFFNLTFEEWDYGTVASEYVSETYCDVFCSWNKFLLANLMQAVRPPATCSPTDVPT